MPAINETIQVGEGLTVFNYQFGKKGWFLRQWNKPERRYRIKKITDATTREEALANFYKAVVSFTETKQRTNSRTLPTNQGSTLEECVEDFLQTESGRVSADLITDKTHIRRRASLRSMLEYFEYKGITYPHELNALSLEDYPVFRRSVRKNSRKCELKDIAIFLRTYLVQRGLMGADIAMTRHFIPKIIITNSELDANPAITPEDYKVINRFMRDKWKDEAVQTKGWFSRTYLYNFVHLLKNSGMRPIEMLSLRRKDITLTNPMRWSESLNEWQNDYKLKIHVRKSKTGKKRDVLCRSNAGLRMKEWLEFQSGYMRRNYPRFEMTGEHLAFGKPEDLLDKPYNHSYLDQMWRQQIFLPLRSRNLLEMNNFSDRDYTLYSLRSTFIEDCITDGLDIYLLARLCGNSVEIIQKYYDRHDVLSRAEEVQSINYGQRKRPEVETININRL